MSDAVKDLLDRAAADSLRGVHLDLPTATDVARQSNETTASASAAEVIPLDAAPRRARWPLGLAAAVLALLAIGGVLLAVQSADDPAPATPTTVPTGDPHQRVLDAIDASVAEVFEVHYVGTTDDRARAASGGADTGSVWDGDLSGVYVKGLDGPRRVTKVVAHVDRTDPSSTGDAVSQAFYETGPDRWVTTGEGEGPNPLVEFRQAAESACAFDRDGKIVVDLANQPGSVPPRDPAQQTAGHPCGSTSGIQYEVTLDSAGRVASINSSERDDSLAKVTFDYSAVPRPRLPDMSKVTALGTAVGVSVDPATGYWTVQEAGSADVVPTTMVTSDPSVSDPSSGGG